MTKIAFITDSTAYLQGEFATKHNIKVVPLNLHWDNETFKDNVDITAQAFYERLEKSNSIPTTSQPSSGEFLAAFNESSRGVEALVAVLISSGISGTLDSALMAKKEFNQIPLEVVDSKVTSAGLALLIKAMTAVAEKDGSVDDVVRMGKRVFDTMGVFFVVDTLKYLHKGGRIGGASAFLGSALDLKPILYLSAEGKIEALEKVRTKKKAVNRLIDIAVEKTGGKKAHVGIMQANALEGAQAIKAELEKRMDLAELEIYELSPVIGTHAGPGTLGIAVHTTEY
ncbi:MAG: DegV family protein [Anaerolineaceae bacterium]|nr:DegV family protein [Anaerolineaceae bacterium]